MPTVTEVTTQPSSGLLHIDALLDRGPGWNWVTPARTTLSYTFSLASGNAADIGPNIAAAPVAFNATQQASAVQVLNRLSQITGITFVATDDGAAADIHFGAADIVAAATAGFASTVWNYSFSGTTVVSYVADAYVYLDNVQFASTNGSPTAGTQGYEVLLHELGHALGLKHPFEGDVRLPAGADNTQNTLMSYTAVGGPYSDYAPYDLAALMWLYGGDGLGGALGQGAGGRYLTGTAASDTLTGTNGGDVLEGKAGNDTLDGGNGSDTAVFSGPRAAYTIGRSGGSVTVSGTDGADTLTNIETLRFSDQTVAVNAVTNRPPTGTLSVVGSVQQGLTLTVSSTLADEDGLGTVSYRWQSSTDGSTWTALAGATGTAFVPTQAQVGLRLRITASYTDGLGNAESVASAATAPVANLNDAPTGSVTVVGAASVGSVLIPNIALADLDGVGAYSYRWQSSINGTVWTDIGGATSPGFVPTSAQVGQQLRVVVSYVDGLGTAEAVASGPTAVVGGPNQPPTGSLTITGNAVQGQTLTVASSLDDVDGLGTLAYRWQSSPTGEPAWTNVAGATGTTLALDQALVGRLIRVVASYTDGKGAAETSTSAETTPVQNVNDAPVGSVGIQGTVSLGGRLTITQNLSDPDGLGSLSYRWQSTFDGLTWNDIPGATSVNFSPGQAESGLRLRAVVSYTDNFGTAEQVTSTPTLPVGSANSEPQGTLTITGAAQENFELQVQNSVFDPDGMGAFNYRWQASPDGQTWTDIASATSDRFTPAQAQVGQRLRVVLTFLDGKGVLETVTSGATTPVINVNALPTGSLTVSGIVRQGETLTAVNALTDGDGMGTIGYRWQSSSDGSSWRDIDGATRSTFVATQSEVGLRLRVQARWVDGGGTAETVSSAPTERVIDVNDLPTGEITVDGPPTRGVPLTARPNLFDADGLGAFRYQWQVSSGFLNWGDIEGATAATFTPGADHVGRLLRVVVSYVDGQGTAETFASGALAPVLVGNVAPTGSLSVSGTVKQGSTLGVVSSVADADGLGPFSYEWQLSADGNTWSPIAGATSATFVPGSAQVGQLLRVVGRYVDGKGERETVTSTATEAVMGVVRGSANRDQLAGGPFPDELSGLQGNDRLTGGGGNDVLIGGEGIDTAVYAGPRSIYRVGPGGTSVQALSGTEGTDTLLQVERLAFADRSLAFDLDGSAGVVARLLGAVFGRQAVSNAVYAGIGLSLLDGGTSVNDLAQLALTAQLGPNFSNTAEITLLYRNLAGIEPSQGDLNFWLAALQAGQYTQASLALLAANLELNAQNIDLVGLTTNGLPYIG